MNLRKLYVMIGTAGSGKTSKLGHGCLHGVRVVSTDKIRGELFNDEGAQREPKLVFGIAHRRVREELQEGHDVVFDATNTHFQSREDVLRNVQDIPCRKVAVLVTPTLEQTLKQNAGRKRKVPEEVIRRQYEQLLRDGEYIPDQFDDIVVAG